MKVYYDPIAGGMASIPEDYVAQGTFAAHTTATGTAVHGLGTAALSPTTAFSAADHNHTGVYQPAGSYLTVETDPVFLAWDKSTGISITESQISDLGDYAGDAAFQAHVTATGASVHGLGNSSILNTGTTAGTVAAGDHTHDLSAYAPLASPSFTTPALGVFTGTRGTLTNNSTNATVNGFYVTCNDSLTATNTRTQYGIGTAAGMSIDGGLTSAGSSCMGAVGQGLRAYAAGRDDNGTIGTVYGGSFVAGHNNIDVYANPVTTLAAGLVSTALVRRGTIETYYGLYLPAPTKISTPAAWTAGAAVSAGIVRAPTVANGYYYVANGAGTTGAIEPTWDTTPGGSTADNDITWRTLIIPSITNEWGVYQASGAAVNYFNGDVGIGPTSPQADLHISRSAGATIRMQRADTSVSANDVVGTLDFVTNDSQPSTNVYAARIQVIATNTISSDINPAKIVLSTTPTGVGAALTPALTLGADQSALIAGKFGCNGAAVQAAYVVGAAAPAGGTGATAGAYDTAANRNAMITLVNNMRTCLINAGLAVAA